MLKLRDAFVLAWTKLLSRKFWTGLFLLAEMILLAGVLFFGSCTRGFESSLAKFNSEGLNGKYLVTASNVRSNPDLERDPALLDLAEELYRKGITEHETAAKRLGLDYSVESEIAPTEYIDGKRELVAYSSYAKQAIDTMMQNYLTANKNDLEAVLEGYPYREIFTRQQLSANGSVLSLEDGAENLKQYSSSNANVRLQVFNGLYVLEEALYQDYFFEDITTDATAIPVVVSTEQAGLILGIDSPGSAASSDEKIQHFQDLKEQAKGLVVEACYRNGASQELIFTAQQILDETERSKDKPYYSEPSLIYDLPSTACGATTVRRDTRTAEEERQDELRIEYQKAIGNYEEPLQKRVKFQIVGLLPVTNNFDVGNDLLSMIQSLGGVSIATPLVSQSYYDAHSAELSVIYSKPDASMDYLGMSTQYIIEFDDAEAAREFINEQSCEIRGSLNNGCATEERRFLLSADNNNSLVVEDISKTFTRILTFIVVAVLTITIIFVALMVIRSITNDRKEIAIFCAIGFRRTQILQIYLTYALILAGIITCGGVVLSLMSGYVMSPWLSGGATSFLRATFFILDSSAAAEIFTPSVLEYLGLCGIVIGVSLLSALLPVLVKSRQNIIDGLKLDG